MAIVKVCLLTVAIADPKGFLFMGNLYTRIHRRSDYRISLLSKLRQLWHNRPINFSKIEEIQRQLNKIKKPKLIDETDCGVFGKHTFTELLEYKSKNRLGKSGKVGNITVSEPSPAKDKKMHSDLMTLQGRTGTTSAR